MQKSGVVPIGEGGIFPVETPCLQVYLEAVEGAAKPILHRHSPYFGEKVCWKWFAHAGQLPGKAQFIGLTLAHLGKLRGQERFSVTLAELGKWTGVSRSTIKRGLRALEKARLIQWTTPPGQKPKVQLLHIKPRKF